MNEHDGDVSRARMHYERRRVTFTDTQLELYQYVAQLGDAQFRTLLDRSQSDRAAWEDALADYLTAVSLARAQADRIRIAALELRLEGLERWAYGTQPPVSLPPPGHDDPEEGHP